ncbi:hypothetical protein E8E12_003432 [Didymella heteroderae]|uniref:Uncharacterized protein n=1 Tax=Didymella heteroderae TaxID=1769908 RepID=A0A9P4WHH7_9PLEO|nr:hypothetical protein E8E12_003432 [Didymella heteroderae]
MENLPVDYFVKSMQFTARTHRDVYAAIDPSQAALSQKGKVVVVTGASQGLGARGFVPSFAAAGPKAIVLVARSADKLQEVANTIAKSHPTVETLVAPTDIVNPAEVQALFEKVKEKFGHADVLINNAGIFKEEKTIKDANHLTLNIRGTFLVTQQFLKQLPSPDTPARIITLTTGAAYLVFPTMSAYGISKLAVLELMAYVAVENPNVVATALHPGVVATDMTKEVFKRFALDTPELIGGIGVWLAGWEGPDRSFLSGRFVASNWDAEDLVGRKDEILKKDLLKMDLNAKLGAEQFQ